MMRNMTLNKEYHDACDDDDDNTNDDDDANDDDLQQPTGLYGQWAVMLRLGTHRSPRH